MVLLDRGTSAEGIQHGVSHRAMALGCLSLNLSRPT
jgi:hypothetical protein